MQRILSTEKRTGGGKRIGKKTRSSANQFLGRKKKKPKNAIEEIAVQMQLR
jgi:hypothetical protein